MIYKTLASTLILSVALTGTAFAQDKSATKPTDPEAPKTQSVRKAGDGMMEYVKDGTDGISEKIGRPEMSEMDAEFAGVAAAPPEAGPLARGLGAIIAVGAVNNEEGGEDLNAQDADVMASGSGAGKANFQDLSLASGGEDRLTENLSIAAPSDGFAPVADLALGVEGGGGKVDVQDLSFVRDPKIGDIEGESQHNGDTLVIEEDPLLPMFLRGPKIGDIKGESQDEEKSQTLKLGPIKGEPQDK